VLIVESGLECAPAKPDSIRGVSQPARDPGTRLAFNRFAAVPTVASKPSFAAVTTSAREGHVRSESVLTSDCLGAGGCDSTGL
jgi:hypothetical protein